MHARMMHMLTTWHAPHDRLMGLQAAARQWSLHIMEAVELAYHGYLWLYKSWAVALDGGPRRGEMACFALLHVSTESDRQIDLSHRVCSTRCER